MIPNIILYFDNYVSSMIILLTHYRSTMWQRYDCYYQSIDKLIVHIDNKMIDTIKEYELCKRYRNDKIMKLSVITNI